MTRIRKFKLQGKNIATKNGHNLYKFRAVIGIDIKVARCQNCTYIVGVDSDGYFGLCIERECLKLEDYNV